MPNPVQPQATNDAGAILTIGIVNNADRSAIVLPCFTNSTALEKNGQCEDAVASFIATALGGLLECMSSDAIVSFVSADGMIDGLIPFRSDFGSTDHVGTQPALTLPSSCGTLITFYQEAADETSPGRVRSGKTNIPGLSQANFDGESISVGQATSALTWGNFLQGGWPSIADTSSNWYRGLATPKPRTEGVNVGRVNIVVVRSYVGTQRRRTVPH